MVKNQPLTVLFLSTGNAARSIVAEALLRAKGDARYQARSAGYRILPEIDEAVLKLLGDAGISTQGLHTKGWGEFLASARWLKVDVIVTLSEEAREFCPAWPDQPVRVHWPVDDPLAAKTPDAREWKLRKCFLTLQNRIDALIKNKTARSQAELLLQLKDIGMVV